MARHSVIGFPLQDIIACRSVADVDGRDDGRFRVAFLRGLRELRLQHDGVSDFTS